MKSFQEFLEQMGSPSMAAKKQASVDLAKARSMATMKQGFWRQRQQIRRKTAQDSEMHNDLERRHALPEE
jgi:hypothetical protein